MHKGQRERPNGGPAAALQAGLRPVCLDAKGREYGECCRRRSPSSGFKVRTAAALPLRGAPARRARQSGAVRLMYCLGDPPRASTEEKSEGLRSRMVKAFWVVESLLHCAE